MIYEKIIYQVFSFHTNVNRLRIEPSLFKSSFHSHSFFVFTWGLRIRIWVLCRISFYTGYDPDRNNFLRVGFDFSLKVGFIYYMFQYSCSFLDDELQKSDKTSWTIHTVYKISVINCFFFIVVFKVGFKALRNSHFPEKINFEKLRADYDTSPHQN